MKRSLHHTDRTRLRTYTWAAMLAVWVWSMAPPTLAGEGKRVAFVVGIGTYDHLSPDKQLNNPVDDAEGVSARLTEIGFQVTKAPNLTRSAFNETWQTVLDGLSKDDTFVLFYSGHGVQIDGQNYLLPRDIPYIEYGRNERLKREAISLNELLADLSTGDRPHPQNSVVILDACRDNPLIPQVYKSVLTARGLAELPQSDGIFVMYAAASNRTALDRLSSSDHAKYSVFTRTLLPLMGRSDLSIQELSNELKTQVWELAKSAGREQRPTYYDGIMGRFCLPGCEEKSHAVRLRDIAISQHLSSEARNHLDKQLDLALLLSVEAYKKAKTTEALQSLYTTVDSAGSTTFLYGRPGDGSQLAFSKDNKLLVSGSRWGTLQLWDRNSTPPRSITLPGHGGGILNLAVSPTNQAIASNDENGNVIFWDLSKTPHRSRPLQQDKRNVGIWLTFNSDGSMLASGSSEGKVLLWTFDSSAEQVFPLLEHTSPIRMLMFTPDQKTLISGDSTGTFLVWDLSVMPPTQRRRVVMTEGELQANAVSPDGKLLAISDSKGHLWLWDLTMDQPQPTSLPGYEGVVSALAFGPNGKKLVAGDRRGTLLVWDLTVEPPRPIPLSTPTHNVFTHGVYKLAFSPNGTTIAATTAAGSGGFYLWDLKFDPPRSTFHGGHQDVVEKLIFGHDGKHLMTSDNHGTYLMWHLHDQAPMSRTFPGHQNGIANVAFTTDGQSVGLVDSVGTYMIWKIDDPSSIQTQLHGQKQAGIEEVNFSDDWTKLSAKSGNVPFVWDRTFDPPRSISFPKPPGGAHTVRMSPDGTRLAVGGRDNITLWDLTSLPSTSISLPSHGHNEYIWRFRFSSDSKFLASSDGRDVLLWNLEDPSFPKPFRADHQGRAGDFVFSPDNKRLASGGDNGTLLLWDLSTTPPQFVPLVGHPKNTYNKVETVLFSPDGQYLVSSDSRTNLVLWDLKSREPLATPLPANRRRRLAAFSPKSDKLVIDKDFNSLSLFDLTGDLLSPISLSEHKDLISDIAFSPNGSLISTDLDGTVLTWDLGTSTGRHAQLWTYQGPTRNISGGPEQFIFSSTGNTLAVSVGNVLLLGDLTLKPPRSILLSSKEDFVVAYAFSPDEKTLAGSYGKQVVLWNVDFDSWVDHACRIANRNLTLREWSHFLPDESHRLTCKIYSHVFENK